MFLKSMIDRQAQLRTSASEIEKLLHDSNTRIFVWYQEKLLICTEQKLYFALNDVEHLLEKISQPIYLGKDASGHYFTCDLNQWDDDFNNLELKGLRSIGAVVNEEELALIFYARGMLNWHHNHPFCSHCGSSSQIINAGHARRCLNTDCSKISYPKIDPAVIFSIENNKGGASKILLGRKPTWKSGRYAVIAGFVEPGETFEEAVRREAFEETGLRVKRIEYVASQPWPFPDSLMIGFACETEDLEISLIDQELESAEWFTAEEIEAKLRSNEISMPISISISWQLIDRWFSNQKAYSLSKVDKNSATGS